MSKPNVRLAVVGVGAVAQTAHLPILSKMRGAELVALCDNDGAKARALAERFGIPDTFTDIEDLLDLDEVDAVIVATVGSSRVDLQACKLEYSIVSPK